MPLARNGYAESGENGVMKTRTHLREEGLPPRVYLKNGAYYYFSKDPKRWIWLARNKEDALTEYRRIVDPALDFSKTKAQDYFELGRELRLARDLYAKARNSAPLRELEFTITMQTVYDLVIKADGHCMLTGIRFTDEKPDGAKKKLWRPSIDRIDSSRGYTPDNVRLICVAANIALQDHGDDVFAKLAVGFVKKRLKSAEKLAGTRLSDVEEIEKLFSEIF